MATGAADWEGEGVSTFAIVPAKQRSTGIPGKNWKPLAGGPSAAVRAINCALAAHCFDRIIVSVDNVDVAATPDDDKIHLLKRPKELAQDETPMVEVVKHAMEYSRLLIARNPLWTGKDNPESEDRFVLIQPTQPLREPKHITQALALLTPEWDSVVSVVELPQTQSPDSLLRIDGDRLWPAVVGDYGPDYLYEQVTRRQDATTAFMRDGTCYAFHRRTVERHGNIYGHRSRPLIIPASETQSLDTPEDWAEAERRLREREATRA